MVVMLRDAFARKWAEGGVCCNRLINYVPISRNILVLVITSTGLGRRPGTSFRMSVEN